jgi:glyoxylase-like metal-dependent hydrolase (beta-lactamase superfamily II)
MRVHHLNCVSACPLGGILMDGFSAGSLRGKLASHCLLLEAPDNLILVDTGYGLRDVADPRSRLARTFLTLLRPELREEYTAVRQIQRLGYQARDVRHIVLSHLDFDHAGGLDDFPGAEVHMLAREQESASERRTLLDRMRYRPQQWDSRARWRVYDDGKGESWRGFENVRQLAGLPPELLMVPLIGHSCGHAGVVVEGSGHTLFYAADAYFYHSEMDPHRPRCTPGLQLYQTMMEKNRKLRLYNQERLRALTRAGDPSLRLFCAHDVAEFERVSGRKIDDPVGHALPPLEAVPSVRA